MYTIYGYPLTNKYKVGCTSDPLNRIVKQQGVRNYDTLAEHEDKMWASHLEAYHKGVAGLPLDEIYYESINNKSMKLELSLDPGGDWITCRDFNSKQELRNTEIKCITFDILNKEYPFCSVEDINWLKGIANTSRSGDSVYWAKNAVLGRAPQKQCDNEKSNIQAACESTKATIPAFQEIRDWATDRGIFASGDPKTQFLKLQEEAGEVARAILKQDEAEIVDGLGDTLVVLINLSHLCGYRLEDCLASAYDVIKNRKGKMNNGTFVKETL